MFPFLILISTAAVVMGILNTKGRFFIPAMASIAGPSIAEIKVRHHARQFGQSKYGISRVYKVLLDLMVIKTVASFTSRPLRWFSLLATPFFVLGTLAVGQALWSWTGNGTTLSLPMAGTGVVLLMAAIGYWILQRTLIAAEGPDSVLARAIGSDRKDNLSVLIYAAAIPLAFFSPWLAQACYVIVALMWLIPDRLIERALAKRDGGG